MALNAGKCCYLTLTLAKKGNKMFDWIINNLETMLAWIGGIVSAATIIVKLTPTTKDDSVLEKIVKVLDTFSVVNPNGTRTIKK